MQGIDSRHTRWQIGWNGINGNMFQIWQEKVLQMQRNWSGLNEGFIVII